jgi:quinoprotein glucose dehydrogenase
VEQGVVLEDANNLTPEIEAMARERMEQFRIGPIFTPPSLEGTLQRPGLAGGANWGGAAYDPESGYLFVRGANDVNTNRVGPNTGTNPFVGVAYSNVFAQPSSSVLPGNLPLVSPPYAVLAAIDLNQGEIAWSVPVGEGDPRIRNHPLLEGVDLPDRLGSPNNRGGAMVTASGLVFIGGGDNYFYAFDTMTGEEVWRAAIPHENTGSPMTYRTRSGRQFIVIATGSGADNALVAFALGE